MSHLKTVLYYENSLISLCFTDGEIFRGFLEVGRRLSGDKKRYLLVTDIDSIAWRSVANIIVMHRRKGVETIFPISSVVCLEFHICQKNANGHYIDMHN